MGPVEVSISTDLVSLIIIPFSDVDGIESYIIARKQDAIALQLLTPNHSELVNPEPSP